MSCFKRLKIIALSAIISISSNANADNFNTLELAERSVSKDCLDYCITGICYFLVCRPWGCYITTRPQVEHNLPDLTASAYRDPGDNPWTEVKELHGKVAKEALIKIEKSYAGGGRFSGGPANGNMSSVKFNELQVIGNPAAQAFKFSKFLCKSSSKPLFPYFMSEVDAKAWRGIITESKRPEALTPGGREIGQNALSTWGSVYPRIGFIEQNQPPKAAAVAAQRAIDIVTREGQVPHIYTAYGWKGKRTIKRGRRRY